MTDYKMDNLLDALMRQVHQPRPTYQHRARFVKTFAYCSCGWSGGAYRGPAGATAAYECHVKDMVERALRERR